MTRSSILVLRLGLAHADGRLAHQILDQLEAGGQPVAALRPARGDAEQAADRRVARAVELAGARHVGDQPGIEGEIARRGFHVEIDIGLDLEIGLKIGIGVEEQRVPARRADDDHLEVERDRLRLGRHRHRQHLRALRFLDADLAVAQRRLEEAPARRVGGERLRPQHQYAAIGAMQRAGADQREIGLDRALGLAILDAAEEILIARIALQHDHRMALVAMIGEQVDGIAALPRLAVLVVVALAGLGLELRRVLQYLDAQLGQPAAEPAEAGELGDQRLEHGARHLVGDAAIELAQMLAELELGARGMELETGERGRQHALGGVVIGAARVTLAFRLGALQPQTAILPLHDLETLLLRALPQGLEIAGDTRLERFAQRQGARLIGFRAEGRAERVAQLGDHRRDAVAQAPPHAGGQAMRRRVPGMAEIVEIDPVIGRWPLGERFVEIAQRRRHPPGAILADHEDVEADAGNREAEIERFAGAGMAVEVEHVDIAGRRKGKAGQPHLVRRNLACRHRVPSPSPRAATTAIRRRSRRPHAYLAAAWRRL